MFNNRRWDRAVSFLAVVLVGVAPQAALAADDILVCGWFSDNVVRYDGQSGDPIDVLVPAGFGGLSRAHSQTDPPFTNGPEDPAPLSAAQPASPAARARTRPIRTTCMMPPVS